MTDATDPLQISDDDEAMTGEVEKAVQHAKRTFDLGARLRGAKLATAKVLVFTDLDAAAAWQAQEQETARLANAIKVLGDLEEDPEEKANTIAEATARFTEADAVLDDLRATAFESALAIHMRAVPQVALDAAIRKATAHFKGDDGEVPEAAREDFYEMQNRILFGQVVTRIVDADGAEGDFDKARLWDALQAAMPVPQWGRVKQTFNALMFNDGLARAATQEPGF